VKTAPILVCGEALMDVFAAGETPTGIALDARIGGSPFNMAVGLARLGQRVAMLTSISDGFLGDRLFRALGAEGVDTSTVLRCAAPTTLGVVGLDDRGVPSYAFYGEGAADRQLPVEVLDRLPATLRAIQLGSYTMVVDPVAATLRALVERRRADTLIAYDPNLRLNVQPDAQRWRDTLGWMLPRTDLLKISDEDLSLLEPGLAPEAFAERALGAGVRLVVVTRGAQGATGWTATTRADAPPVPVTVVDTVGAGDTFQAALLTWLAEQGQLDRSRIGALPNADLAAAIAFATRAAAITCSRRGADLPRRAELSAR
jgi:fructokinase